MSNPKLPPLEYCHIDRASRLLECEIEDILHWHEIGAIKICIRLDGTEKIHSYISEFTLSKLYDSGVTIGVDIPKELSFQSMICIYNEHDSTPLPLRSDIDRTKYKSTLFNTLVECYGFWALVPYQYNSSDDNTDIIVYSTDIEDKFNIRLSIEERKFGIEDMFIMKHDIDMLLGSNGQPLPNYINGKSPPIESDTTKIEGKKIHRNQEINSSKRERILLAAMYVMKHYPDECLRKNGKESLAATAKAVCNHSYSLFGTEEPPITNVRIISEIIADGYRLPKERKRAGKLD
ncbi:TPA: hypothetical protein ACGUIF_004822 [Serratia liquefaciens]